MTMLNWKVAHGGKTPPPGEVVRPDERLAWPLMAGLGAQHVVAMFGATFVFPVIMGLNPNLAVLMSGVATIIFLLIVKGKVPSYLGTSASFVGAVAAIRAQGGDSADVTGSILVAGVILAVIGVFVHFGGAHIVRRVLPPAVTGAVVMLIGFNLAAVATGFYFPADQWVALLTTVFVVIVAVGARGFVSRIAIFLGLIFGYALSWVLDQTSLKHCATDANDKLTCVAGDRIDFSEIAAGIGGLVFGGDDSGGPQAAPNRIVLYHENFEGGDRTIVKAIIDFDRDEDFEILLYGRHELTEQDFILAAREPGQDGVTPHQG